MTPSPNAVQSGVPSLTVTPSPPRSISLSTFQRPKELQRVLASLLAEKVPSLLEIVVLWNNFDEPTPANFTSDHGVSVRYRKPDRDSLNEKLRADPGFRTQAVLLSDDDIYYRPADLEFAFRAWRDFGRHRVVGGLARCAMTSPDDGSLVYDACPAAADSYSMVLTDLAFAHVSFLDLYWRDDLAWMADIRNRVDRDFNCEDIAFNYLVSLATGNGPLLVRGRDQYVNLDPPGGISRQAGHMRARSECLNDFADTLRCVPLVDETARIERGPRYNVWYKSVWDRWTG